MRPAQLTVAQLPSRRRVLNFEGGSVFVDEKDGRFYIIVDESTMASLLDEEDLQGMSLVHIVEFDTENERFTYLNQRFHSATLDTAADDTL